MRLTIRTVDGNRFKVRDFDESTVMDMVEEAEQEGGFLRFQMGEALVWLNTANVVSIELD